MRFFWFHPQMVWGSNNERWWNLRPLLKHALKSGHIISCQLRPWYVISPVFLFRIRGLTLSRKQWKQLRIGPPKHTQMIHRISFKLQEIPASFPIFIDEGIQEPSRPGAWGALSKIVADIFIQSHDESCPHLWIECERTTKKSSDYQKKFRSLPKNTFVIYVAPNEKVRGKLSWRLPSYDIGLRPSYELHTELSVRSRLKRYLTFTKFLNSEAQYSLFIEPNTFNKSQPSHPAPLSPRI